MSADAPAHAPIPSGFAPEIAIVASEYNGPLVEGLLRACAAEIERATPQASVSVYRVPGAFEIAQAARLVAGATAPDAIIALGVVIRGETAHAELISEETTSALMRIALEEEIPVTHEVLLLDNQEQARERCLQEGPHNRGAEAARAALRMAALFGAIRTDHPAAADGAEASEDGIDWEGIFNGEDDEDLLEDDEMEDDDDDDDEDGDDAPF